ncbi:winged helix-turn-helix transcriptional regulator [Amycolatopsis lurida]
MLTGPKRFGDLQASLRGLGTGLLAARLKHLEREGLAHKITLPPPARTPAYALTEAGEELGPPILELARWGLKWAMGERRETETFHPTGRAAGATCPAASPVPTSRPAGRACGHRCRALPGSGRAADGSRSAGPGSDRRPVRCGRRCPGTPPAAARAVRDGKARPWRDLRAGPGRVAGRPAGDRPRRPGRTC